jgi:hypothetical protein
MSNTAAILIYKTICLAVGVYSIWLGYRLFIKGIITPAGDLTTSFNKAQVAIKSGAPGVFFSVIGGFVICFTLIKGFALDNENVKKLTSRPGTETEDTSRLAQPLPVKKDSAIAVNNIPVGNTEIDALKKMIGQQNRIIQAMQKDREEEYIQRERIVGSSGPDRNKQPIEPKEMPVPDTASVKHNTPKH